MVPVTVLRIAGSSPQLTGRN
ncbi:unnamed protein product [Cuscuta epithymum]|uniref:Uncharacterized protein n=1 Tax=Cuscuta epithymum TaxID=186058 RepID=A0AAV0FTP5_9ASTE|nr:unnamed protein product [Cuscuta epithymum]